MTITFTTWIPLLSLSYVELWQYQENYNLSLKVWLFDGLSWLSSIKTCVNLFIMYIVIHLLPHNHLLVSPLLGMWVGRWAAVTLSGLDLSDCKLEEFQTWHTLAQHHGQTQVWPSCCDLKYKSVRFSVKGHVTITWNFVWPISLRGSTVSDLSGAICQQFLS